MASATRSRCAHSIHRPSTITMMPTHDRQVGFDALRPQPALAEGGEHADQHDAAGVGQRDEDPEDHRVNRLAARANDVGGRDRLAVSWCRRVCGARPEARRDEEQEFPRSDNRQLWCSSPTAKCCSINFGKCAGVDPRHQQYQPLSFHPELYSNGSAIRTTTPCQGLGICMSTICTFSNGGNAKESSDELRGQ